MNNDKQPKYTCYIISNMTLSARIKKKWIMYLMGGRDRCIDRYIGQDLDRHSTATRSILGWVSLNISVGCRPIYRLTLLSVDIVGIHRYFTDASPILHRCFTDTSPLYRSIYRSRHRSIYRSGHRSIYVLIDRLIVLYDKNMLISLGVLLLLWPIVYSQRKRKLLQLMLFLAVINALKKHTY